MYPVYRYMDPYPPQSYPIPREPNHYPYHHYPNWENSLPHVRVDSSKSPSAFEPWPHYDAFSHPNPTEPHSCCNHSYPPGYYSFRPPFPHMQPPPQIYYHGPYPPHPDAYSPHFAPLPHYDLSRYPDPEKANGHCCGCPNHTCHPNRNSLKIEEQKNESEPDKNDPSTRLIQHPNYTHPVMWIPPGCTKDMEGDQNSGWVPLDMNTLKGMRQGEEKKDRNQDKEMQLPWPIIWMPPGYKKPGNAVEDLKEVNDGAKSAEESPSKVKIIPLKLLEDEKYGEKPEAVEDLPTKKQSRTKTIPVIQADEANNTKPCVVEKQKEKGEEKKSTVSESQDGVKRACVSKQQSPKKSSKLPPICLRLDPLPKKKSVNGALKAPSPTGCKADRAHHDNEDRAPATKKNVFVDDKLSKQDVVSVVAEEKAGRDVEVQNKVAVEISESKEGEESKGRRRVLLESDAALIIQSAYRGWEVRRWQPLEKLRRIAQVREQVASVKKQVEGLEPSLGQQEMKQRVIINETIMNLLLQLDALQGLHPSVREIRKALARDLTCLQEKLDCLGSQVIGSNEPTNIKEIPCQRNSSDESLGGVGSSPTTETAAENSPVHPAGNDGVAVESEPEHPVEMLPDNAAIDISLQEPLQDFAPDAETPSEEMVHVPEQMNNHEEKCSLETSSENEALDHGLKGCLLSSEAKGCAPDAETGESEEVVCVLKDVSNQEEHSLELLLENESLDLSLQQLPDQVSSAVKDDGPDAESGRSEIVCVLEEPLEKSQGGVNYQEKHSVEMSPENVDLNLDVQEILQESDYLVSTSVKDGALEAETEVTGEIVDVPYETLEKSEVERSNLEGTVPSFVEANNSEEAPPVFKAEEPEPKVGTGEPVEVSTVEYESVSVGQSQMPLLQSEKSDTRQEELRVLPSMEDNKHGDNNERMVEEEHEIIVGKTVDTSSPVSEVLESVEENVKDVQLNEVSNETIKAFVSEAPLESAIENADDEGFKDVRDELRVLPSMEDNKHGDNNERMVEEEHEIIVGKTVDTSSPVSEVLESVEENVKDVQLKEVSNETIEAFVSEAPLESAIENADDEGLKDVRDAAAQFNGASPVPQIEMATDAHLSKDDAPLQPEDISPIGGLIVDLSSAERKLVEENAKLRLMLEQLMEAGKQQLGVISDLNGRVQDLEKKLVQRKRVRVKRGKLGKTSPGTNKKLDV